MTTRSEKTTSLIIGLRRFVVMSAVVSAAMLCSTDLQAQTNANGGNGGGNSLGTDTNAAAGEAGSTLTNQNVFSSTSDTVGEIGNNDGRFTSSRLATQPTAGGNTNTTQQNAFNNARNLQRLNQQFNRANQNRNFNNQQRTRTIRPTFRLGFTPRPRPTKDLRETLGKRLNALSTRLPRLTSGRSEYASVKFDFAKPGAVVLTGSVPTDDAAALLANILRMEPGVASVRNELKIAPEPAPAAN